jgi:hypothetical protein
MITLRSGIRSPNGQPPKLDFLSFIKPKITIRSGSAGYFNIINEKTLTFNFLGKFLSPEGAMEAYRNPIGFFIV